jgi:hypothetical protein
MAFCISEATFVNRGYVVLLSTLVRFPTARVGRGKRDIGKALYLSRPLMSLIQRSKVKDLSSAILAMPFSQAEKQQVESGRK